MPRLKHSKRYREVVSNLPKEPIDANDAVKLTRESATAKFDESIEIHLATNADPRHADQQLREVVALPHSLGDVVRVLVFAEGEAARIATEAGADYIVDDELLDRIQGGWTDWEVSLATPDQMPKVGRLGRVLGPRGLMPNPRNNTVVQPNQLESAINSARQGRQELRMDRHANLHARIGRKSFTDDQLLNNLAAVYETVSRAKPEGVKGQFVKAVTLCSAMGPGIKVNLPSLESLTVSE
jgi:large subunit ribosomal protein L1